MLGQRVITSRQELVQKHRFENRWVLYKGKIGIATKVGSHLALFNAVDEYGFTYLSITVPLHDLKQAHYTDIPDVRKPTKDRAQYLGYEIN